MTSGYRAPRARRGFGVWAVVAVEGMADGEQLVILLRFGE